NMSIVQDLSIIALRQVAKAVGYGVGEAVFSILVDRFTNHTEQLNKALKKANERAWQTLESALVGPSVFNLLKPTDDQIIIQQMHVFLDSSQLKAVVGGNPNFCKRCLAELRAARKEGKLTGGQGPPGELARQAGELAVFNNDQSVLDAEWTIVKRVATELQKTEYSNLAKLLNARPANGGSPILASSVRFFFRREIETNQPLFQGLVFAEIENISE